MKKLLLGLLLSFSLSASEYDQDIAVIVNQNNYSNISKIDIVDIFLGKRTVYAEIDLPVQVVILDDQQLMNEFNTKVLEVTAGQLLYRWSRALMIDNNNSPIVVDKPSLVLDRVVETDGSIGYIPIDQVTNEVRVVYVLRRKN